MKEFVQRQAGAKLLGLVLVVIVGVMGFLDWNRDAKLRELQVHSIASLEGGLELKEFQHVQVVGAKALGKHLIDTSQRRLGGQGVSILVAVGSANSVKALAEGRRAPLRVWLQLPQRFASPEEAEAFLSRPQALPRAPFQGLWVAMDKDLAQSASPDGDAQGARVLRLGSTPAPVGSALGMLAAALVGLLMGLVWAASEWRAWRWSVAQAREGVQAFAGVSRRVFVGAVSAPLAALGSFFAVRSAVDLEQFNAVGLACGLVGFGVTVWALLTKDTVILVGPELIERLQGARSEPRDLGVVRQLFITPAGREDLPAGLVLHCKHASPLVLGNGWRAGAVMRGTELTRAVRQRVFARLAPAYARGLAQHKPFDFSGITLTQEGLAHHDDTLPWEQIERVDLMPQQICIYRQRVKGVWARLPISKTPNVDVLLHWLRLNRVEVRADSDALLAYWTLKESS
jgi:hypothetical protein